MARGVVPVVFLELVEVVGFSVVGDATLRRSTRLMSSSTVDAMVNARHGSVGGSNRVNEAVSTR